MPNLVATSVLPNYIKKRSYPMLMRRALKQAGIKNPVVVLQDGQEAIDYLAGSGKAPNLAPDSLPVAIFSDIKMPRMSGLEFLDWMKGHPEMRVVPTILLTSSEEDNDVARAYELGANAYFVKPGEFSELVDLLKAVREHWRRAVKPKRHVRETGLSSAGIAGIG